MIHLDANILIALSAPGESLRPLLDPLASGEKTATSAMAWFEFLCGPFSKTDIERATEVIEQRVEPVTESVSALAALLYNKTGRRRGSNADCIIAATAIIQDASLFTLNQEDFAPFVPFGLQLFA